jgi:hypothetical protein
MYDATNLDQRLAEHVARGACIDRHAWMREASVPAKASRTWGLSTGVASIRRHAGMTMVRAGERLQGATADRVWDRQTAG